MAQAPSDSLSDRGLIDRSERALQGEADEAILTVMRVATAFQLAVSFGAMALMRHPAPASLLARLVDPDLVSVSTLQLEELVELARGFRVWEGAADFLGAIGPEHASADAWRARLPPPLFADVERWLERFGHRGPYESDLASPRPAEDLRLLAAALRPMVLAGEAPETREARRARRRADAAAAWREARIGPRVPRRAARPWSGAQARPPDARSRGAALGDDACQPH
jgi:hypothetical protein